MSAARESFQEFIGEAGCIQSHRQIRRKVDNSVVLLILLPMNTTKVDVFHFVNEEVKKMVCGEPLSITSFHRMWRTEFPHVQIPPFSRFSKCYHYWEYKYGMKATTNAAARVEIKNLYVVHINIKWMRGATTSCLRGQHWYENNISSEDSNPNNDG
jgi:hypothetical protein